MIQSILKDFEEISKLRWAPTFHVVDRVKALEAKVKAALNIPITEIEAAVDAVVEPIKSISSHIITDADELIERKKTAKTAAEKKWAKSQTIPPIETQTYIPNGGVDVKPVVKGE